MDAQKFETLRREYDMVPVVRHLGRRSVDAADLFDVVTGSEAVLYEDTRFSYVVSAPRASLSLDRGAADGAAQIRKALQPLRVYREDGLPPFFGGAIGFLGYGVAGWMEKLPDRHAAQQIPEARLMFFEDVIAIDRETSEMSLITTQKSWTEAQRHLDALENQANQRPEKRELRVEEGDWKTNCSRQDFLDAVKRAREAIAEGEAFQIVVSQRWETAFPTAGATELYRSLRALNPSPYMFLLRMQEGTLVGSSPEMLVRVRGNVVETRPIAGTRPRGSNAGEDAKLEAELLGDEKENAEHLMLVDLGRNDVGRVSARGTIRVTEFRSIERYSHVMHIVSHVTGQLRKELVPVDALLAAFPAGTVTGAPKIRAMELIDELEFSRRGPYAGAVVIANWAGDLDSAITIRTALLHQGRIYVQAGAGIVFDSVPEREFEETMNKAAAIKSAVAMCRSASEERRGEPAALTAHRPPLTARKP
jgi:anthranilate synthase component 1